MTVHRQSRNYTLAPKTIELIDELAEAQGVARAHIVDRAILFYARFWRPTPKPQTHELVQP